jgi:hypothetical protein
VRLLTRIVLPGSGWARVYARMTETDQDLVARLSAQERRVLAGWRCARRSRDWLEGRACLKDALADERVGAVTRSYRPSRISALPEADDGLVGRPVVAVDGRRIADNFSISHWPQGVAVAMSRGSVGVDGEESWPHPGPGCVLFNSAERRLLPQVMVLERASLADAQARLWTLTEATWKAVSGCGGGRLVGLGRQHVTVATPGGLRSLRWRGGRLSGHVWACVWEANSST